MRAVVGDRCGLSEPEVLELLEHGGVSLRDARPLIARLDEVGTNASVELLRDRAFAAPDPVDRRKAAQMLQRIGTSKAQDALVELLQSGHSAEVFVAARALGVLGARQALPALIARLEAGEPAGDLTAVNAQRELIRVLGRFAHPHAVPVLAAQLEDPRRSTRRLAAWALSRIGEPAKIALQAAVRDNSWWRSRYARRALRSNAHK
jgi:HEAT repeat protein